jgi:hypothetical protein
MNQRQKGVALIEFALIVPFLLLLSITTIELGRAIWEYNTLTKSVRDAARYLSIRAPGSATEISRARNLMIYGDPDGGVDPLALGLSSTNVPDPTWQPAGPGINTVTARISGYTFRPMFANVFGVSIDTMRFSDISATVRSYQ